MVIDYVDKKGMMNLMQVHEIERCLKNFNMELWKAVSTLMEKIAFSLLKADAEPVLDVPIRKVIYSLLYLSMCPRPDISYAVATLAQ